MAYGIKTRGNKNYGINSNEGCYEKYNRGVTALRNITISVNQGEFVYLVGPSGAGKSTFIRLFYREERTTKGLLKLGNLI